MIIEVGGGDIRGGGVQGVEGTKSGRRDTEDNSAYIRAPPGPILYHTNEPFVQIFFY